MTRAVLSIGSNLGDRLAHLQMVVDALGPSVTGISGVYETAPWGGVEQQDFLNAVVLVDDSSRDGYGWLRVAHELEERAARVRDVHWGPRTLDVDVVDCAGERNDDPVLTLPHPRAHERAFVLVPWLEADAAARLGGVPLADLLATLPAAERDGVLRTEFVLRSAG